jgi:hypothetical protein
MGIFLTFLTVALQVDRQRSWGDHHHLHHHAAAAG